MTTAITATIAPNFLFKVMFQVQLIKSRYLEIFYDVVWMLHVSKVDGMQMLSNSITNERP